MELLVKLLAGAGLAIPCGLSPYLPLLVLSIVGVGGKTNLAGPFGFVGTVPVLIILAILVGLDIFADKFPRFQQPYTLANYLIRPVTGALAFGAVMPTSQLEAVFSVVLGAGLALVTYLVKNNLRPALVSRNRMARIFEPLISFGEDLLAVILALVTLGVAVLGGVLSLLLLAAMIGWLVSVRRQTPALPETSRLPKSS